MLFTGGVGSESLIRNAECKKKKKKPLIDSEWDTVCDTIKWEGLNGRRSSKHFLYVNTETSLVGNISGPLDDPLLYAHLAESGHAD